MRWATWFTEPDGRTIIREATRVDGGVLLTSAPLWAGTCDPVILANREYILGVERGLVREVREWGGNVAFPRFLEGGRVLYDSWRVGVVEEVRGVHLLVRLSFEDSFELRWYQPGDDITPFLTARERRERPWTRGCCYWAEDFNL